MRNLILGLARPMLRLLGRDERGAIGVLIAMMFGAGVLTGMGALVIDTGQLFQERAELQNVADAGALAVAKSCQSGTCASTSVPTPYVTGNASALTGNTAASTVCGSVSPLTACTASTGPLDCPTGSGNYVDVHTSTKLSGGATLLPPAFAKTLLGNSSYTGTTVQACAQAEWSGPPPPGIVTTAFTISACEWWQATTGGTVYASATAPSPTLDRQIMLRSVAGTGCTQYAAPADAVSLFGWMVEGNNGGCTWNLPGPGPTYPVSGSPSTGWDCSSDLFNHQQNHNVTDIPVYTSVTSNGVSYNLKGIYAFVVTGYSVPSSSSSHPYEADWLKTANNCPVAPPYCIDGYFVQASVPAKLTG
jgi:Flp pilus assembly protein TadG